MLLIFTAFQLSLSQFWLPRCAVVKNLLANAGVAGSIPELGRSPGEGNGNPFRCSCLRYPMDRGAWRATVHGVAKSWTRLNTAEHSHFTEEI